MWMSVAVTLSFIFAAGGIVVALFSWFFAWT
jgi:hypothetical protein